MQSILLKQLFAREIAQAICWTFIHSLWQGLLLAIIVGSTLILTRKSSSRLRYNVVSGLFFLFVIVACSTFIWQLNTKKSFSDQTEVSPQSFQKEVLVSTPATSWANNGRNYLGILETYFDNHASAIVLIWFIVFSAQCLRLSTNIVYAQRIKNIQTFAPPVYWQSKLEDLGKRLQVKKYVRLLESKIVNVPMVVGLVKPVILFPFSLLSQLPQEQVEAILLHELAHIKRKDYLINLLQHFAETIFFFNPAVLWISSLIKDERENCCDDIAIRETKSKEKLIHALVSFQEYSFTNNQYALAFPAQKNHLLNRIKRIITNNNKTLNNMEKVILSTAIIVTGFFTATFSQSERTVSNVSKVKSDELAIVGTTTKTGTVENVDTIPAKKKDIKKISKVVTVRSTDGKEKKVNVKVVTVDGKVKEFYVDDKKVPYANMNEYQQAINDFNRSQGLGEPEWNAQAEALKAEQLELLQKHEQLSRQMDELKIEQDKALSPNKAEMEAMKAYLQELKAKSENLSMEQQKDLKLQQQEFNKTLGKLKEQVILDQKLQRISPDIDELIQKNINNEENLALLKQKLADRQSQSNDLIGSITTDLRDAKIISDDENLSVTLDNDKLIVNGVKQTDEICKKFKAKYLNSPQDHIIFSASKNSTKSDISIGNNEK